MMKKAKILLLFLFLPALYQSSFAQYEWMPVGAKWFYNHREGFVGCAQGYMLVESIGDTTINERNVRKLKKEYHNSQGESYIMGYEYLYYEDGVVSYWRNNQFYTLYDFNANLGDHWAIVGRGDFVCNFDTISTVEVTSVGTTIINGEELRFITVEPDDTSHWRLDGKIIEYIGCFYYLFPVPGECGVADVNTWHGHGLRCYEAPDFGLYKVEGAMECDSVFNAVSDIHVPDVSLYPNPVNDILHIEIQNNRKYCVKLCNTDGKVIFAKIQEFRYAKNQSFLPEIALFKELFGKHGLTPAAVCFLLF